MKPIDAKTLRAWQIDQREFVLVDTLLTAAYNKGHLPGAMHIVSDNILNLSPSRPPDREQVIVVYCASINCKRADLSAERLESLGYGRVYHFIGGKREWIAAGFPLESTGRLDAG